MVRGGAILGVLTDDSEWVGAKGKVGWTSSSLMWAERREVDSYLKICLCYTREGIYKTVGRRIISAKHLKGEKRASF